MKGDYVSTTDMKVVCIPENTDLEPDSLVVNLKYAGGDKGWYVGHAEATVDFKLKKKSEE